MKLRNELPLISIALLPIIYLAFIWNQLPDKVPLHWNVKGEIDWYGDKTDLLLISIFLPLLTYLIFLVIPIIDPKNKIKNMGNKFQTIKVLLTSFISILTLFIIYSAKAQDSTNINYLVLLIGTLYIFMGNYFKTIRANYFLGIRTPWTLESEFVWKETHKFGGVLWLIGGFLVVISSLIFESQTNFTIFIVITGIIAFVPIIYSYFIFQKEKRAV